jgi:hypothetical protein
MISFLFLPPPIFSISTSSCRLNKVYALVSMNFYSLLSKGMPRIIGGKNKEEKYERIIAIFQIHLVQFLLFHKAIVFDKRLFSYKVFLYTKETENSMGDLLTFGENCPPGDIPQSFSFLST